VDYLKAYESYLRMRKYSSHTLIHYMSDLQLFQQEAQKSWLDVTKEDIVAFVNAQVKMDFSSATINRRLYVIKGFYEYLREELDCRIPNPVKSSQIIRQGRRLPRTIGDKQLERLLKVITDKRDKAVVALMLRCGLRVGEVANLKVEDLNIFSRELRFVGKGNKERVVPIPDEIFDLLLKCIKIRPQDAPRFFWNKKKPKKSVKINSIQRLLKRYAKKAGVDEVHCHLLRHTFARQMIEKGVERTVLRDLLGHASISTTDVYGKLSDPFVRESYFKAMDLILDQQMNSEDEFAETDYTNGM
jgi:site-specific recombinase XerD